MHKLIEYACDRLEELEKKAEKGNLSMAETEYAEVLSSLRKNLLKGDMLYDAVMEDGEYSGNMGGMSYQRDGRGGNRGGNSYARGRGSNARRDSMGRYSSERGYSRDGMEMADQLRDLMEDAPDETIRKDIERLLRKVEQM
jgi:hypothetical protein